MLFEMILGVFSIRNATGGVYFPFRNVSMGCVYHFETPRGGIFSIARRLGEVYFTFRNASDGCTSHLDTPRGCVFSIRNSGFSILNR